LTSLIGFSALKITPEETHIPLGGYYVRYSTGVHDDVFVRILYMATGEEEIFIIACDLLSFFGRIVEQLRNRINYQTGVKAENILICALHDHSAPDINGLEGLNGFLKNTLNVEWFREIKVKIIKSAILAKKNATVGKIGFKSKILDMSEKLVINRRHPRRPLKYPLSVWKVTSNGTLKGSIINYACHGTTLNASNKLISAEYPGYLIRKLEKQFAPHFSMYLNGPCGDINPYLFPIKWNLEKVDLDAVFAGSYGSYNDFCSYEHTERIGEGLADQAISLMNETTTKDIEKIQVINEKIEIPVDFNYPNKKFKDFLSTFFIKKLLLKLEKAYNRSNISYLSFIEKKGKLYAKTEIQLIKINDDMLVIGIPAEAFSEIGEELVKKSPTKNTVIVELANDFIGYIFPLNEIKYGGYEVDGIPNLGGMLPGTYIKNRILKLFEKLSND